MTRRHLRVVGGKAVVKSGPEPPTPPADGYYGSTPERYVLQCGGSLFVAMAGLE